MTQSSSLPAIVVTVDDFRCQLVKELAKNFALGRAAVVPLSVPTDGLPRASVEAVLRFVNGECGWDVIPAASGFVEHGAMIGMIVLGVGRTCPVYVATARSVPRVPDLRVTSLCDEVGKLSNLAVVVMAYPYVTGQAGPSSLVQCGFVVFEGRSEEILCTVGGDGFRESLEQLGQVRDFAFFGMFAAKYGRPYASLAPLVDAMLGGSAPASDG